MTVCEHWFGRNEPYGTYVQYGDLLYWHRPGLGNGWVEPPTDPYWFTAVGTPCVQSVLDVCIPDLCASEISSSLVVSSSSYINVPQMEPSEIIPIAMIVALQIGIAGLLAGAVIRLVRNIFK